MGFRTLNEIWNYRVDGDFAAGCFFIIGAAAIVGIMLILMIAHHQQQPEIAKEYESLVIEQQKIKQCVEAHYPVDLNLDAWHGCLRDKGLLR